jgi:hypothetical protein
MMEKGMYEENGISLSKTAPRVGEQVDIMYRGLLKESGASNVKLHFGYNDAWEDSQYIEMDLSDNIFMATVPILKEGILNFAFTDPVGNWDNNSGLNYSIPVGRKRSARGRPPLTGPDEKRSAGRKTSKTAAKDAGEEIPVKKTGRTAAKTEKETAARKKADVGATAKSDGSRTRTAAGRKASLAATEQEFETGKTARGRRKAVQAEPEAPLAHRSRGAGRKTKKEP